MALKKPPAWGLVLIGVVKLIKASLLVFVAAKAHQLVLSKDAADTVQAWVHWTRIDPHNRFLHGLISHVTGISHHRLQEIRLGSFIYAALFATEGTGLVLRQRWAEYFTTISTSLLVPLELYEIFHGTHHAVKIIVLLINLAIVAYLIARLRGERRRG